MGTKVQRLRQAHSQEIFATRERIKAKEDPAVIAEMLRSKPPPAAVRSREIMPKLTKAAAMRTGCNFQDLALSLYTLRWAVAPIRHDQTSAEPFTAVNMNLHMKNGNNWRMGVGDRWKKSCSFNGVESPDFLVSPGLVDLNPSRKYVMVGRKNRLAALPSACPEEVGPGKYDIPSAFDKFRSGKPRPWGPKYSVERRRSPSPPEKRLGKDEEGGGQQHDASSPVMIRPGSAY